MFRLFCFSGSEKVKELEEEHSRLSENVLTLSTHFAHIQFRLQQINSAPAEQRDVSLNLFQIWYTVATLIQPLRV